MTRRTDRLNPLTPASALPVNALVVITVLGAHPTTHDARLVRFTAIIPPAGSGRATHRSVNHLIAASTPGAAMAPSGDAVVLRRVAARDTGAGAALAALGLLGERTYGSKTAFLSHVEYASGAAPRKRNGGDTPDATVRFSLSLPVQLDRALLRLMEEHGLTVQRPFKASALSDDAVIDAVVQGAVDAALGGRGHSWEDVVFDDDSAINDPSEAVVTVHGVASRPGGLFGPTYTYDVTVSFPPAARYKRNGRRASRARDTDTLDLFAARPARASSFGAGDPEEARPMPSKVYATHLRLHPDLLPASGGYPVAVGGSHDPERIYRELLEIRQRTNLDPALHAENMVRGWLTAQNFVPKERSEPGVPSPLFNERFVWVPGGKNIASVWDALPANGQRSYTPNHDHPSPDGFGLSFYTLSFRGRIIGLRWVDDAAAKALARGLENWTMRPRREVVLDASIEDFGRMLDETTERIFVDREGARTAEVRDRQRTAVSRLSTTKLRELMASSDAPEFIRLMWRDELIKRDTKDQPSHASATLKRNGRRASRRGGR